MLFQKHAVQGEVQPLEEEHAEVVVCLLYEALKRVTKQDVAAKRGAGEIPVHCSLSFRVREVGYVISGTRIETGSGTCITSTAPSSLAKFCTFGCPQLTFASAQHPKCCTDASLRGGGARDRRTAEGEGKQWYL